MATGTSYDPRNILDFEKSKLNKAARGMKQTVTLGGTCNIDYTLADDMLLAGGSVFLVENVRWGDKVTFQVLNGSTVLAEFITDWYLNPETKQQAVPSSSYPAKIYAGLTLRIIYTSTGNPLSDPVPEVCINYNFEKVLV